jgi:hypothetical protein
MWSAGLDGYWSCTALTPPSLQLSVRGGRRATAVRHQPPQGAVRGCGGAARLRHGPPFSILVLQVQCSPPRRPTFFGAPQRRPAWRLHGRVIAALASSTERPVTGVARPADSLASTPTACLRRSRSTVSMRTVVDDGAVYSSRRNPAGAQSTVAARPTTRTDVALEWASVRWPAAGEAVTTHAASTLAPNKSTLRAARGSASQKAVSAPRRSFGGLGDRFTTSTRA